MRKNLSAGMPRRLCAVLAAALVIGCDRAELPRRQQTVSSDSVADSMGVVVRNVSTVPLRARRELVENSAAAMSTRQPGVLFTINDSGNDALLFAIDTTGADRGVWRVLGATNVDWEAASMGPCASGNVPSCVYIGDTGDNVGTHATRAIYRFPEPTTIDGTDTVRAEALRFTYSDQRHDVEAMYVAPNGDVVLITKRPIATASGQYRSALVFRVPASAWGASGVVVAQLADSLPIVPGSLPLRLITDASLAPDAKHLAVRTYAQVYVFATDSVTGAVNHAIPASICDIVPLGERQGEGVTWANARGRLVFTSEGRKAPINLGECPVP